MAAKKGPGLGRVFERLRPAGRGALHGLQPLFVSGQGRKHLPEGCAGLRIFLPLCRQTVKGIGRGFHVPAIRIFLGRDCTAGQDLTNHIHQNRRG